MKIRIAVLAAMILANVAACAQSPTAVDPSRRSPVPSVREGDVTDTTSRGGGLLGSNH
ncbi:MAG TPA: hypothetical protein VF092_16465 [Longimicrobium sp.]